MTACTAVSPETMGMASVLPMAAFSSIPHARAQRLTSVKARWAPASVDNSATASSA